MHSSKLDVFFSISFSRNGVLYVETERGDYALGRRIHKRY